MTSKPDVNVLILTKADYEAISDAVSDLSTLLWRTRYRREAKLDLPPLDSAATVLPLYSARSASGHADLDI